MRVNKTETASRDSSGQLVLLFDDDPQFSRALARLLVARGFLVEQCCTAASAVAVLNSRIVSLILLDYWLGDVDALAAIGDLRRFQNVPVIMLTGNMAMNSIVACLEAGADDYVTKPFHTDVLVSRMRAVVRRAQQAHARGNAPETTDERWLTPNVLLDVRRGELRKSQSTIALTRAEVSLLTELLECSPAACSRDRLSSRSLLRKWAYGDRSVDVLVSRLRMKLRGVDDAIEIRPVRNEGYAIRLPPRPLQAIVDAHDQYLEMS